MLFCLSICCHTLSIQSLYLFLSVYLTCLQFFFCSLSSSLIYYIRRMYICSSHKSKFVFFPVAPFALFGSFYQLIYKHIHVEYICLAFPLRPSISLYILYGPLPHSPFFAFPAWFSRCYPRRKLNLQPSQARNLSAVAYWRTLIQLARLGQYVLCEALTAAR